MENIIFVMVGSVCMGFGLRRCFCSSLGGLHGLFICDFVSVLFFLIVGRVSKTFVFWSVDFICLLCNLFFYPFSVLFVIFSRRSLC